MGASDAAPSARAARQTTGGRRDLNYMANPSLFINRDPSVGFLSALEFGRVSDGQRPSCWRPLDENFAYFVPERARRPRGFHVIDLDEFDPWASEVEEIWSDHASRRRSWASPTRAPAR